MMEISELAQRSVPFPDDASGSNDLRGRIHHLESTLAQRQEEIAQLRAELEREQRAAADDTPIGEDNEATIAHLTARLADADGWILKLARDRHDLEVRNASLDRKLATTSQLHERASAEVNGLSKRFETLNGTIDRLSAERDAAGEAVREREREIDRLNELVRHRSELIRYKDDVLGQVEYRAEWLRRMLSVLTRDHSRTSKSRLLALLPAFLSLRRQRDGLREAGLFNGKSYLALHHDVKKSKADPLRHYVNHGVREGRAIGD